MDLLLVLLVVAVFPFGCLGFVLWMGRIEDSIPGSVARTVRRPDPAPVLRIPVRRPVRPVAEPVVTEPVVAAEPPPAVHIPAQRTEAVAPVVPPPSTPAAPATPAGT